MQLLIVCMCLLIFSHSNMAVRFVSYKPVFDLESDDNYLQYVSLHDPKTFEKLTTANKVQRHISANHVIQLGNGALGYTYLGNGVILLGSGSLGYSSPVSKFDNKS